MEIQPFGDRVVVKILLTETKVGGLLVTPTSKENSNKGEVVAIGEDVKSIKIGDTVLFNLGTGLSYSTSSNDYRILNEKDVLGKILGE